MKVVAHELQDQVILGIVIGIIIGENWIFSSNGCSDVYMTFLGFLSSHVMKFSHKRGYLDHDSYVAQCFALAVFTMGVVKTIGSDDLLAVFFAGTSPPDLL